MNKINSLLIFSIRIILTCSLFLGTFFSVSVTAMNDEKDDRQKSHFHPLAHQEACDVQGLRTNPREVKSLLLLTAEKIMEPFKENLKTSLGKAAALKQEVQDQKKAERQTLPDCLASYKIIEFIPLLFEPVDDPIFRTEKGKIIKQEIKDVLNSLSFILDDEEVKYTIYEDIKNSEVKHTLSLEKKVLVRFHDLKQVLADSLLNYLSEEEKELLPADHVVSRILYWEKRFPDSSWRFSFLKDDFKLVSFPRLSLYEYKTVAAPFDYHLPDFRDTEQYLPRPYLMIEIEDEAAAAPFEQAS